MIAFARAPNGIKKLLLSWVKAANIHRSTNQLEFSIIKILIYYTFLMGKSERVVMCLTNSMLSDTLSRRVRRLSLGIGSPRSEIIIRDAGNVIGIYVDRRRSIYLLDIHHGKLVKWVCKTYSIRLEKMHFETRSKRDCSVDRYLDYC